MDTPRENLRGRRAVDETTDERLTRGAAGVKLNTARLEETRRCRLGGAASVERRAWADDAGREAVAIERLASPRLVCRGARKARRFRPAFPRGTVEAGGDMNKVRRVWSLRDGRRGGIVVGELEGAGQEGTEVGPDSGCGHEGSLGATDISCRA